MTIRLDKGDLWQEQLLSDCYLYLALLQLPSAMRRLLCQQRTGMNGLKAINVGDRVKIKIGGQADGGGLSGRKGKVISEVCGMFRVITDDGLWHVDGYFRLTDLQRIDDG